MNCGKAKTFSYELYLKVCGQSDVFVCEMSKAGKEKQMHIRSIVC